MLIVADGLKCHLTGTARDKDVSDQKNLVTSKPVFGIFIGKYKTNQFIKYIEAELYRKFA